MDRVKQQIHHYAKFPATALSLSQMAQFGRKPTTATIFRASQFMADELPVRLAHRVRELESLPAPLASAPSILKVKGWYIRSFEEITQMTDYSRKKIPTSVKTALLQASGDTLSIPPSRSEVIEEEEESNEENGTAEDPTQKQPASQTQGLFQFFKKAFSSSSSSANSSTTSAESSAKLTSKHNVPADVPETPPRKTPTTTWPEEPEEIEWPEEVQQYHKLFAETLTRVKKRHDSVVTTMAQGIKEYKDSCTPKTNGNGNGNGKNRVKGLARNNGNECIDEEEEAIQAFLNRFYMSRLGIRMLIGQQLALMQGNNADPAYVGIINTQMNVSEIAQYAIDLASQICEDWYGLYEAPKVVLECDPNLIFMYIPGHLSHMIFEIVKNSLRAVVETYGIEVDAKEYPPVHVIVANGTEDITIKISDRGGGIPRSVQQQVWTYMYTTVKTTPSLDPEFNQTMMGAPMAGFGYGLPITRLYARYFGGDVILQSVEGYGTDVYMHLNKLSARELIY